VSSHILSEISETCDRILVVGDGRIVASGTESELVSRLSGSHRVSLTLRVTTDRRDALQRTLGAVAGVTTVKAVSASEAGTDVLTLEAECSKDVRAELVAAAVASGAGVLQVMPAQRELENVFLRLAGETASNGAAVAAATA
jgi:ABC-2 type transport system ATP-binding protein